MESVLTIRPPRRRASASARADLPLAVGPAIRIAFLISPSSPDCRMPLVATIVSHPGVPLVSRPLATMAAAAVGASAVSWLADDLACDLLLPPGPDDTEASEILRRALASEP